jgi:DNA-binding response OmpR family regulator
MLDSAWDPLERRSALEGYADECLAEDGEPEELAARLTALCRRVLRPAKPSCSLSCGPLRLDFVGGFVEIDGTEVPLQPLQLRILGYFMQNVGEIVTRDALRRLVFRVAQAGRSTSIPRQICVLRRQLGPFGAAIQSVGGGYRLALT